LEHGDVGCAVVAKRTHKGGLADARFAGDEHQSSLAAPALVQVLRQLIEKPAAFEELHPPIVLRSNAHKRSFSGTRGACAIDVEET
jgi:hypothetical protein